MNIIDRIDQADWQIITEAMHTKGYALVKSLLDPAECKTIIEQYSHDSS